MTILATCANSLKMTGNAIADALIIVVAIIATTCFMLFGVCPNT